MKLKRWAFLHLIICVLLVARCSPHTPSVSEAEKKEIVQDSTLESVDYQIFTPKMAGLNFVAIPERFRGAVMEEVKAVNATWIAQIGRASCRERVLQVV